MQHPAVRLRRRSRTNSNGILPRSRNTSLRYFIKPTLGDKLQRLAQLSPKTVVAIEFLVDQLLRRIDPVW